MIENQTVGGSSKRQPANAKEKTVEIQEGRIRSLAIGIALLASAVASHLQAGENRWTSNGPTGERVLSLAIDSTDPANVYAGAESGGIFKTTNFGLTWSAAGTILVSVTNPVFSLSIDSVNSETILAGTQRGLFRSADAGGNWSRILSETTYILGANPAKPATVYAGTARGVSKSTDGGASWTEKLAAVAAIYGLVVDPQKPSTVYAADTEYYGAVLYKTGDDFRSWTQDVEKFYINRGALAIDPKQPSTLYAGTVFPGGVFKSTDAGATWRAASGDLAEPVTAVAIDRHNPSTLYAGTSSLGVYKSADGGSSWEPFNAGLTQPTVDSLAIDASGTHLDAGTARGVFENHVSPIPCVPESDALCLMGNRFQLTLVARQLSTGRVSAGRAVIKGDRFGYFSLP
ncbi:MAG: hypothetical protein ABJC61_13420, partial [Acidobacteriota bacterium]